jgi:tellurite resistance protein TerC
MTASPVAWLALIGAIVLMLAVDLFVVGRRGGEMSLRFASLASVFWVAIALTFGGVLLAFGEQAAAADYVAGYLVEKSLSLDNVFVFLLVFGAFGVAQAERHRLLTYGIAGALVMRGVFIVVGAAALEHFSWIAYLFAALLVYTGYQMFRHRHDHDSETELVEKIQRRLPGAKAGGAALAAIAIVDVIFAVDSVPAILAITPVAFVVFAANAFALLGLRPLFFLVAELVDRLYYLKTALSVLLIAIGAKMAAGELFGKIGPEYSLPGIALILGTGVLASLARERRRAPAAA